MSGASIGSGAGTKSVSEIWFNPGSGARSATEGWIGTGAGARRFFARAAGGGEELAAVASPDSQGWAGSPGNRTADISVAISGGVAPYTINWVCDGGDEISIDDASATSTTVHSTTISPAAFHAEVSDAAAGAVSSNTILVG